MTKPRRKPTLQQVGYFQVCNANTCGLLDPGLLRDASRYLLQDLSTYARNTQTADEDFPKALFTNSSCRLQVIAM